MYIGKVGKYGEINVGMFFRKMYCSRCGTRLKRNKITIVTHKGEDGFSTWVDGMGYGIGTKTMIKKTYNYKCPQCGKQTMYDEQLRIARRQKILGKKIISPPEEE